MTDRSEYSSHSLYSSCASNRALVKSNRKLILNAEFLTSTSRVQGPGSRVQGVGHGILKFYLRLKPEQWLTKSQVGNKIFYGFQQREMSPNYYKLERIKENNCPSSCEISVFDLSACWRACLISRQLISA